jgi:exopolysaccharide production protein ExoZ
MRASGAAVHTSIRLSSLDLLRAAATLLVLFYHVHAIATPIIGKMPFGGLFQSGSSRGVDFFCVLSGFTILWRHAGDAGQPGKWRQFMVRRLLRIYPAAVLMTLFAIMVYASGFGGPEKAGKLELQNVVLSLLLMADRSAAILNVAWTLKYVVFSYVLFGIAILDFGIGAAIVAIWQVAIILHVYAGFGGSGWDAYFLEPIGLEFGIGMVFALLMRRMQFRLSLLGSSCLLTAGVTGFVGAKLFESYSLHQDLPSPLAVWVFGVSAASMIAGLCSLDLRGCVRVPRFVTALGVASLSIYLVNYSTLVLTTKAMQAIGVPPGGDLLAFTLAALAICAGLVFHGYIDQPIQRSLARVYKRVPMTHGRPSRADTLAPAAQARQRA